MNDWFKDPDTSTLRKLEALGEKVTWTKDFGDCYVLQTKSTPTMREKSFGFKDSAETMHWKLDKKSGKITWIDYISLILDEKFQKEPNYDLTILDKYRF